MSSSRKGSVDSPDSNSWMEWTQQLQAYIAWVNSQLKKKPNTRIVEDLRRDMVDGVALVQLVEIVAGEKLAGVNYEPANPHDMKENIERVLQFMAARRIRMHHTTAKDIVEGNLKSIMRLILALAAHFKPDSVKHSAHQYRSPRTNVAGIAQAAAAALADARRDVASMGQRVRRPKELSSRGDLSPRYYSSSDQQSDSDHSYSSSGRIRNIRAHNIEGASPMSSPVVSASHSPQPSGALLGNSKTGHGALRKSLSADFDMVAGKGDRDQGAKAQKVIEHMQRQTDQAWNEVLSEQEDISADVIEAKKMIVKLQELEDTKFMDEVAETRKILLQLQNVLLSGQPGDEEEDLNEPPLEGASEREQLVVLRSRLQQSTELCNDLREELSKSKNECMQLQGTKAGLQQRMQEQETTLLQLKAELLRQGFTHQTLENEKVDYQKKLSEKEKQITDLKRELMQRDNLIRQLEADLHLQLQEKDNATRGLRNQIQELNDKLMVVGETELSLSARVSNQDRKMAKLEGKIMGSSHDSSSSRPSSAGSRSSYNQNGAPDELQVVRDSLKSIRSSFRGSDPQHHTIDTLETGIATLMEKLKLAEQSNQQVGDSQKKINYDSTGDKRRSPITALPGFPVQRLDSPNMNGDVFTKVLYFTERTVTPFMKTIGKRLGEITLRDFRALFDRPGNYRFHFKALDPEFGTVKEEVTHDDDIIPGWEGKIVAWIEEDHG
ncbi:dixin-like isoform X2 [Lingula anatina]|uniref:Dixin n=1 Tax=Lingula anatina TaxID=7574 RepID=A0A2R2MRT9_LINAN|nr:dixin-like isoform X2 [Lingula anatina]|eukprot:XP_023932971.1 dixin-like isoform X2 [Lingula anatina]